MQSSTPQIFPTNTPKEFENFSFREIQCAWNYCCQIGWVHYQLLNTTPLDQKINILVTYLNSIQNKEIIINQIIQNNSNLLIDYNYFNWIDKNDKRLIIHIIHAFINTFHFNFPIGIFPNLYQDFITNFDAQKFDLNTKINFINNQKNIWAQIRTNDVILKWLDHNNTTQLNWAWGYLGKFNKRINVFFTPIENNDLLYAIQASFDYMSYGNPSDKILFMERMKKTWSQKKFRDSGKAKKPYHIPLTKSTQAQLEKLAEIKNLSKNEVLQELIIKEYEAINLDEKGKTKY